MVTSQYQSINHNIFFLEQKMLQNVFLSQWTDIVLVGATLTTVFGRCSPYVVYWPVQITTDNIQ